MVLMLKIHPSRAKDLRAEDGLIITPGISARDYRDGFGNICSRIVAPPGIIEIKSDFVIFDSGMWDEASFFAQQTPVENLPDDTLVFLLGSRYCDTQKLSDFAWQTFGGTVPGWRRVQAICDFVHDHIRFGYGFARADRTASDAFRERVGVCRDFTHLAVTLCRCMNFPARYCTGYLGDIGVVPIRRRWTSAPGSRCFSMAAGSPLMPGTTGHVSVAS